MIGVLTNGECTVICIKVSTSAQPKTSSPRAKAGFLLSLFMSLEERILVVLEHDSRGYQVLFMRDFVIWPVWKFVKIGTLVQCFKFPYAIAR